MRRLVVFVYPGAFALSYVVLTFSELPTPVGDLIRPSVVAAISSVLLAAVLAMVLRSPHRGAVAASAVIVAVSAAFLFLAVIAVGVTVVIVQVARRRWTVSGLRGTTSVQASRTLGVVAGGFLVASVAISLPSIVASIPAAEPARESAEAGQYPDIYLILLDGYPRGDTLATAFGHDNRAFEAALTARGFSVASESHSNYTHSWLTMSSMLHGRHIADIPGLAPAGSTPPDQYRSLMRAIADGEMVRQLRRHGYGINAVPPPFRSLALSTADQYLDGGQLTDFEYSLLTNSQVSRLVLALSPDFYVSQQRDRFEAALGQIRSLASGGVTEPQFLLAHIFSPPHAPLVFGANGERIPMAACVPDRCSLWEFPDDEAWAGLGGQVAHLNERLLETIDGVLDANPDAIIVLMSDHGSRRSDRDPAEHFRTLFAARTPGQDIFPADIDPVNVLRRLSDAYFGTDLGALPYEAWLSPVDNQPLDLIRFDR